MGNNEALKTLWVYIKKHKLQGKLKNFNNLMEIMMFLNILISRNFFNNNHDCFKTFDFTDFFKKMCFFFNFRPKSKDHDHLR